MEESRRGCGKVALLYEPILEHISYQALTMFHWWTECLMHTAVLSPPGDSAVDVDSSSQLQSVSPSPGLQTDTLLKWETTLNLIIKPIMIQSSENYVCSFFYCYDGLRLFLLNYSGYWTHCPYPSNTRVHMKSYVIDKGKQDSEKTYPMPFCASQI